MNIDKEDRSLLVSPLNFGLNSMQILKKTLVLSIICGLVLGNSIIASSQMLPSQSLRGQGSTINVFSPPKSIRTTGSSFGSRNEKTIGATPPMIGGSRAGESFREASIYKGLIYQVHILGEVNKPGTYRVTASTRLFEALRSASGILDRGSERRIELRRNQSRTRKIDLLSFKQFGNLNDNPYLLDNDVIFVPLKKKVVEIRGTVKRPEVYELRNEKNLEDLVQLAGGLTPGAGNPESIKVIRFKNGIKDLIDVQNNKKSRRKFLIENGDVIVFPHFLTAGKNFDYKLSHLPGDNAFFYPTYEERVFVLGAVRSAGPYPYSPYYDVRHYITIAGGITKLARSERKWRIVRTDGERNKARLDTKVNPGDTIVIPEKYMAPESMLSLALGLTTSILGITTTVLTLTR